MLVEDVLHEAGNNPIVYIAGPMRGIENFNFPAFDQARNYLNSLGKYYVVSPADLDRRRGLSDNTVGEDVFEGCMKLDLAIVAQSEAVFLLGGWEKSRGVANELFVAKACGVPIWQPSFDPVTKEIIGSFITEEEPVPELLQPGTMVGEVRVTDPDTGGAKGQKPAQLGAIDPVALLALARVGGMGADKYDRFNYLNGYKWSLSFDAALRHTMLAAAGEDFDEESGLPHAAHAAWNLMTLTSFLLRKVGTDDRPPAADLAMLHALVQGTPLA
jgi:hypothetical protein